MSKYYRIKQSIGKQEDGLWRVDALELRGCCARPPFESLRERATLALFHPSRCGHKPACTIPSKTAQVGSRIHRPW